MLKKGDVEARDVLIERNIRLVISIVRKYENTNIEPDDLVSIGIIGLIKGIDTFKPEKGNKLATYTTRCIENEIRMYLRKNKNKSTERSFDEPINTNNDGDIIFFGDMLGNEDERLDDIFNKSDIAQLCNYLKRLSPMQEEIIRLRYGINSLGKELEGITQKEVANTLNISQSYVSRVEKKAKIRLRNCFNNDEKNFFDKNFKFYQRHTNVEDKNALSANSLEDNKIVAVVR